MKKFFFLLFITNFEPIFSQNKSDLGINSGVSCYMGDLNASAMFYSPKLSAGITYRYNLNIRYVIKAELNYITLYGNSADLNQPYPNYPPPNNTFNAELYDISLQFEFNFLPLKFNERKMSFSPFVSTGLATAMILNSKNTKSLNVVLPGSLGIRLTIGKKWSTGAQWSFRKMFNDMNLDNVNNYPMPNSMQSTFFNNDWYFFSGVFLTYKIFDFGIPCPAYETKF